MAHTTEQDRARFELGLAILVSILSQPMFQYIKNHELDMSGLLQAPFSLIQLNAPLFSMLLSQLNAPIQLSLIQRLLPLLLPLLLPQQLLQELLLQVLQQQVLPQLQELLLPVQAHPLGVQP